MMNQVSYPYMETLIQLAKENYPRVKAFDKQINIAQTNIKKSKNAWFDIFSFAYMRTANLGATDNKNAFLLNGYQYGLNFNLGSLLVKQGQIKTAKVELAIAELDKAEYHLELETLVKERYITYIQKLTVLNLRMKSASDAESILKSTHNKFERGEVKFDSYNEALLSYSKNLQDKISAESDMLISKVQLEQLIGKKLEEVEVIPQAPLK
ncbi:MAG TPA: TolC family protein [Chitinophagaceae bacterium]|nr:TolC family protein [Chitinophagaceae bacterium]